VARQLDAQELADLQEKRSEVVFETWRSWAAEQALKDTERNLQGGGPDGNGSRGNPTLLFVGLAVLTAGVVVAVVEMWR